MPERFPGADFALGFDPAPFGFEPRGQPSALLITKPMCQLRPIGDAEQEENADRHGRDGFGGEHPLPAGETPRPVPLKSSAVDIGAPAATASAAAMKKPDTMRARCQSGNQYVKNKVMPGNRPASAGLSKKRMFRKLHGPTDICCGARQQAPTPHDSGNPVGSMQWAAAAARANGSRQAMTEKTARLRHAQVRSSAEQRRGQRGARHLWRAQHKQQAVWPAPCPKQKRARKKEGEPCGSPSQSP